MSRHEPIRPGDVPRAGVAHAPSLESELVGITNRALSAPWTDREAASGRLVQMTGAIMVATAAEKKMIRDAFERVGWVTASEGGGVRFRLSAAAPRRKKAARKKTSTRK